MKPTHLAFIAALAFSAAALRAQTQATAPVDQNGNPVAPAPTYVVPPPPPGAGYSAPNAYNPNLPPATMLAGDVSFPYATDWKAPGISGELGALLGGHHFIGGEISYYDSNPQGYNVYNGATFLGHFRSRQEVTTVDAAYKYFVPLWGAGQGTAPVDFYIGGSAGVGYVNYGNEGNAFGFRNRNDGVFNGEGEAGLQLNLGQNLAVRLGYRYLGLSRVWKFDRYVNLSSNVVEAGLAFHF